MIERRFGLFRDSGRARRMRTSIPRPAILDTIPRDRHAVIEASAGTGKTYTIEHLVVDLLMPGGVKIEEILVLTFTERAAAELRQADPGRDRQDPGRRWRGESAGDQCRGEGESFWSIDDRARKKLTPGALLARQGRNRHHPRLLRPGAERARLFRRPPLRRRPRRWPHPLRPCVQDGVALRARSRRERGRPAARLVARPERQGDRRARRSDSTSSTPRAGTSGRSFPRRPCGARSR